MDAQELLKSWPDIGKAGAMTLLSMPSWRMPLELDGREAELVRRETVSSDEILLSLDLDGEALTLGLSDSPLFPDLHILWEKRQDLPPAVVLALVEKECGVVFGSLEAATRKLLSVKGLADAGEEKRLPFLLRVADGEVAFSLSRNRTVEVAFGRPQNIDCTHESVRELPREVVGEYAVYAPDEVAASALKPGDLLLLPEGFAPAWRLDDPTDDSLHLRGTEPATVTFAQLVDDTMPPVPAPQSLKLMHRGVVLATGEVVVCGDVSAFRIKELV